MADNDDKYKLGLIFADQSQSFAHGMEAGMLYYRMANSADFIDSVIHSENREVMERIAEYLEWDITILDSGTEGWDYFNATKKSKKQEISKQKPKLTIVKD